MIRYIIKRLLLMIPTLLVTSLLIFWAMDLAGGDPVQQILPENATVEQQEALRVVRVKSAARLSPTVAAGIIKYSMPPVPPDGSHPSLSENKRINIRPSQKFGMDTPKSAKTMPAVSFHEFW